MIIPLGCKSDSPTTAVFQQPNVLLIVADDQGWGDLSVHGNPYLHTRNIDRLAKESVTFSNFYVSPLCAPTRASLLTGRYHLRTGTVSVSRGLEVMKTEEMTLAELLKDNGYATGCFGKWHNGEHYPENANGQGFDEFFGFSAGHWSNYFDTHLERNGKKVKTKGYLPDVLTDEAIAFMKSNKDTPFFCYVPLNTPHSPHQVPDTYFKEFKDKGLNDELASIYGMVQNIDDNVGRLLKTLKKLGIDENTIVIYMSDNGPNGVRYNGELKGAKGSVDEGGVKVPFFLRWSTVLKPKVVEEIAAHIDVLPTLADLCQLKAFDRGGLDGISLKSVLSDTGSKAEARALFTHVAFLDDSLSERPGSVRWKNFRLTIKDTSPELYDLANDPSQTRDIASTEQSVTNELLRMYSLWFHDVTKDLNFDRPVPLSDSVVQLQAHEANVTGNVRFFEGHGWAHDWLVDWSSQSDSVWWSVDNSEDSFYDVYLNYTNAINNLKVRVSVASSGNGVSSTVPKVNKSPVRSPDRVKRKEAYEQQWGTAHIGKLEIPKGRQMVVLKIPSHNGQVDFALKSIELKRVVQK